MTPVDKIQIEQEQEEDKQKEYKRNFPHTCLWCLLDEDARFIDSKSECETDGLGTLKPKEQVVFGVRSPGNKSGMWKIPENQNHTGFRTSNPKSFNSGGEPPKKQDKPAAELNDEALVEVKCSYANRFSGEPPNYLYKVASYFKLKRDHKYYYQIQGQLHCTGLELCYLVVYTFPRLFIMRVYKDAHLCNRHMIPKLNRFYYQYFKPLIADKQHGKHGLGVRM